MRSLIPAALVVAGVMASSSVIANAAQFIGGPNLPPAPVGHLQPRTDNFAPRSYSNQAEQDRLSAFDAQQQKRDETLDKNLNICRC
jgi:hypothetical protein